MNVNCIICSDLFSPTSEIYTTKCGHVFHYYCLIQWIERSRTCPQCRNKATEDTIHRVYFNLSNTEGIVDDVATLQSKLDNLKFQLNLRDKDVKIYTDKYKNSKSQNVGLREEIRDLEAKQKVSESAICALKEQVSYFKLKAKDGDRLSDEVVRLKDKLKDMESVHIAITGTNEQVSDMLRHNRNPESLGILVSTLKKELLEADKKYKQVSSNLKHIQTDVSRYRKDIAEMKTENSKLKNDVEAHKNCEKERVYLKRKLSEMDLKLSSQTSPSSNSNTTIKRLITESPVPLPKDARMNFSSDNFDGDAYTSPLNVADKVKNIMDSDSPYLTVKSSNVGLSCLVNPKFTTGAHPSSSRNSSHAYNLFKQPPRKIETVKRREYSYDGFGGHSKEERYPSPSPKPVVGIKRHKSASTISSVKFRKLAPNKNLKDFFNVEDE